MWLKRQKQMLRLLEQFFGSIVYLEILSLFRGEYIPSEVLRGCETLQNRCSLLIYSIQAVKKSIFPPPPSLPFQALELKKKDYHPQEKLDLYL